MSTLARADQPTLHSALHGGALQPRLFDANRTKATVLLAAIVSAFVLVGHALIERLTGDHVVASILMWAIAFASIVLLAKPVERLSLVLAAAARRWAEAHARAVQDRIMWELALSDSRVMADLRAAHARAG